MGIVPAIPSASVIIIREASSAPEFLLVRRNTKIDFHGGAWVFPGGKVDAADHQLATDSDDLAVAYHAAVREVHEEAGITIQADDLSTYSHWTTPENQPKRFAAWFFVATAPNDCEVEIDRSEIVDYRWMTAAQALRERAENEIALPPPAFVSLTKLGAFTETATMVAQLQSSDIERFEPRVIELDDGRCSLYAEDAGYTTLELDVEGPRHRCVMRKSGWVYVNDY